MNFRTPKWVSRTKNGYICTMFVRKKNNPSGVVSIQVIDKSRGKYRVVKGLINKTNLSLLESAGYKFIIGARIKNETDEIKHWIFS